jgi:hypothetical protein
MKVKSRKDEGEVNDHLCIDPYCIKDEDGVKEG